MEETKKKEFKDTLNLPQTTLAMRANATVRELEIQKFWEENKIYEKNVNQKDKVNSFILHDRASVFKQRKNPCGDCFK